MFYYTGEPRGRETGNPKTTSRPKRGRPYLYKTQLETTRIKQRFSYTTVGNRQNLTGSSRSYNQERNLLQADNFISNSNYMFAAPVKTEPN